jgi:hypothetical protein
LQKLVRTGNSAAILWYERHDEGKTTTRTVGLGSLLKESIEMASAYRNNVRGEIHFTQKNETEENGMVVSSCPLILSVAVLAQLMVWSVFVRRKCIVKFKVSQLQKLSEDVLVL